MASLTLTGIKLERINAQDTFVVELTHVFTLSTLMDNVPTTCYSLLHVCIVYPSICTSQTKWVKIFRPNSYNLATFQITIHFEGQRVKFQLSSIGMAAKCPWLSAL